MSKPEADCNSKRTDYFRDTNLRYMGYANEVGESLRPIIPVYFVRMSYGIAIAYVCGDTIDKTVSKLWCNGPSSKVLSTAGDVLIWQSLASVIIPGITINRIVHHSNKAMTKYIPKLPPMLRKYASVCFGLVSIPIIITPIDRSVDLFMNLTYRTYFR